VPLQPLCSEILCLIDIMARPTQSWKFLVSLILLLLMVAVVAVVVAVVVYYVHTI